MERVLVGVIGVSVVAFGIFLACCVDPEESSFLGRLAHWVTETLPAGLIAFAKLLRVWWIFSGIARAANYFVNERHPVVRELCLNRARSHLKQTFCLRLCRNPLRNSSLWRLWGFCLEGLSPSSEPLLRGLPQGHWRSPFSPVRHHVCADIFHGPGHHHAGKRCWIPGNIPLRWVHVSREALPNVRREQGCALEALPLPEGLRSQVRICCIGWWGVMSAWLSTP